MDIVILVAGIAVLILVHELGHFLAAKRFGLLVEEFGVGFPPKLWAKKIGETLYTVNALPLGGFVKIHGERAGFALEEGGRMPERSFSHQRVWKRTVIIVSGVVMNFLFGWLVMSFLFFRGVPQGLLVQEVLQGSPAEARGILPGDVFLNFKEGEAFQQFVAANRGKEIRVELRRETEQKTILVTPRADVEEGALGVVFSPLGIPKLGFFASVKEGFITSLRVIGEVFRAMWRMVGGTGLKEVTGPVGIFQAAKDVSRFGMIYLLQLLGMISLNLAALNILPIPALDGGRLLFLIIEKIKGSPLNARLETVVNAAGFAALILLMLVITARDIYRIF